MPVRQNSQHIYDTGINLYNLIFIFWKKNAKKVTKSGIFLANSEAKKTASSLGDKRRRGNLAKFPKVRTNHIKHTDKILTQLKEAEKRQKETGNRTLFHIDGFDQLINPKLTEDGRIESLKSVLSNCAKRFHSTIIFSTADTSKLDQIAIQDHRVKRIDVDVSKASYEKAKSATQKVRELGEKLKNLPKTKIFAGAGIGLVIGAIGIGIRHLILQKKENITNK